MNTETHDAGGEGRLQAFGRKHQTGLVTLVFTDLVGSTQLKQRLGDWLGVRRIQEHHGTVRSILAEFPEAAEISTAGDSFFLVFARPSDAVLFALRLQRQLRDSAKADEAPLRDRIGIHLGEVVIEKGDHRRVHDLYGLQVDLCARLMSLAGADQILVSSLVYESARGAVARGSEGLGPIRWERHGRYQLKGVDQPVEVHEVGEEGIAAFWKPPGVLVEEPVPQASQVPRPEAATPVETPRRVRRVPWPAVGVGFGLLVLAGLLGWRWLSPKTERLAILPFHSQESGPRADDFGIGLAERVEARLQEEVRDSRTLRFSPLRDAVENGVTNAALAGSKLAADLVVQGSLSRASSRRRLVVSLQARAANGVFIERRSVDVTQKPEETLAQFEERLAGVLAEWLGVSRSKKQSSVGSDSSAGSEKVTPPIDPELAELHLEGLGALRNRHIRGSLEKSVRDLRLAYSQRPDDRDICADYAEAMFWSFDQLQDLESLILAQKVAERNANREPPSERASAVLGLILVMTDRPTEAVPHLRRALARRPSNTRALVDLARALAAVGDTEEALRNFNLAIKGDPNDWYAYNQRGRFFMQQGDLEAAEKEFIKVARIAPGNYQGLYNVANLAMFHRGDRLEGRKLMEQALANDPPAWYASDARAKLGWSWLPDNPERGIREMETAAREVPENIDVAMMLGEALMSSGDGPERSRARQEYGRALRIMDQRIQHLRKISIDPSLDDRMDRAKCLAALGRFPEAFDEIGMVVSRASENPDVWLVDSVVAAMAGKNSQALQSMRKAHQLGVSKARMRDEWPLRPLLKDFQGDERPEKKTP
jgi:class 3 adenylate cyclase/Flp pilus assembly protein TadD